MRRAGALALLLSLGGCAGSTVLLLPGEAGAPAGAVAVLDEKAGTDAALIAQANERAELSSRRVRQRALKPEAIARRDLRLVEDLPPPPRHFTLNFPTDSVELMTDSEPVLAEMFAEVRKRDGVDVLIIGYTDRLGTPEYNDTLSLERATAIRAQLIARGLDPASTKAVGRGERDMAVATRDGVSAAANRRVEVVVR